MIGDKIIFLNCENFVHLLLLTLCFGFSLTNAPTEPVFEGCNCNMHPGYIISAIDELAITHNSVITKWKKKVRRMRPWKKLSNENEGSRLILLALASVFILFYY